ncbi:MAG: hypothetical protein JNJ69_02730 [Leptospiraceae bacterium]|nr:hypothetical protein [Leptospiraceae bacterium]
MEIILKRRIKSRADIAALSPEEREQFRKAMWGLIREKTIEDAVRWCDKELVSWLQLELRDNGTTIMDVWSIANMDDAIFFWHDTENESGIVMSQTFVSDEHENREGLILQIQAAMDAFEGPEWREWERDK